MNDSHLDASEESDAVPCFGSWRNAYVAVTVAFVLEVIFFYFVSRFFL